MTTTTIPAYGTSHGTSAHTSTSSSSGGGRAGESVGAYEAGESIGVEAAATHYARDVLDDLIHRDHVVTGGSVYTLGLRVRLAQRLLVAVDLAFSYRNAFEHAPGEYPSPNRHDRDAPARHDEMLPRREGGHRLHLGQQYPATDR